MLRCRLQLSRRLFFSPLGLIARYSTKTVQNDTLRPYQRSCIEAIKESLDRRKRPAISLPTGSGKTHVFSYLLQDVKPMFEEDINTRTKVLVIVNRKELMDQSLHRIRETHPNLTVLPISGIQPYKEEGDVFVSTYQTLMREARLETIDASKFKLIVIDEAHHSVAASYIRILTHFNAVIPPEEPPSEDVPVAFEDLVSLPFRNEPELDKNTDPEDRRVHVVGFSATFWRNDSEFLREVYDEIAFHENVNSMIDSGYLCPAKITKIQLRGEELRPLCDPMTGTLRPQDFFQHPSGLELVFNAWNANSSQKSTVIFGCNLAHISNLVTLFRNNGVDARLVHGSMPKRTRADVLYRFGAGEFPVLMNCQVLTEGTDIPRIDQVMIARGLKSTGMAMQMIGRGLRPYQDKEFCNVILFANFARFEGNLDFIPQLESMFEHKEGSDADKKNDREIDIEATDVADEEAESERAPGEINLDIDYGKLVLETKQFEPALLASKRYRPSHPLKSALMWLEWQKNFYLFPVSNAGYFSIKRQSAQGLWIANFVKRINSRFTYSKPIITSSNLIDVLAAAELHALSRWGAQGIKPLSADAKWHYEPPTPKQIKLLEDKNVQSKSGLNRGTAAGLLNLNSIGCKVTPELVNTVHNLIGRYKKQETLTTQNETIALGTPPVTNQRRFRTPQHRQKYIGLLRSR